MPNKFQLYTALAALCIALLCAVTPARAANAPQEIDVPAWFKVSFLDLRDDFKDAAAGGKRLMLYFGQNGCPYCKQLMAVNFQTPTIVAKTRRHFDVIEINILGSRDVTWTDGTVRTEKAFARYLKVGYTPTLLVIDERGAIVTRINGYLPPAPFTAALDYVVDGAYRQEPDLQSYLKSRGEPGTERATRIENVK
jgi:thioredoxin-related protein